MNPALCDHSSQRVLDSVRWCEGCGSIRHGDAEWTNPTDPDQLSAYTDTVSGRSVCILDPRPEDYDLEDVAHHLAMQVRFNGALPRFYGVGEHCVNVAVNVYYREGGTLLPRGVRGLRLLELPPGADPRRFWGAVLRAAGHDASEAILGDCVTPLKNILPAYQSLERRHMRAFHTSLGFGPDADWADVDHVVHRADKEVCAVEHHVLRGGPEHHARGVEVKGWHWSIAKAVFLDVLRQAQRGFEPYRESG